MEKLNVFNFRALRAPLWTVGWRSNRWLLVAVAGMLALQGIAVYAPFMQRALHTVALDAGDWLLAIAIGAPLLAIAEALKHAERRRARLV
jgi:Ca2+-transporting ATPase